MTFTGYVEDYRLRDLIRIGQKITILDGSLVRMQIPKAPSEHTLEFTQSGDKQVTLTNFLPGYVDTYADSMGKRKTHNHQVVWITNDTKGEPCVYNNTDINNVREIRDAD